MTTDRNQREPRPRAEGDASLNKVFIQVRGAFIEPFMEFDFQRLVTRQASGDSLVEPKPDLLIVLRHISGSGCCCALAETEDKMQLHRTASNHTMRRLVIRLEVLNHSRFEVVHRACNLYAAAGFEVPKHRALFPNVGDSQ